jgi:hypothetical protein
LSKFDLGDIALDEATSPVGVSALAGLVASSTTQIFDPDKLLIHKLCVAATFAVQQFQLHRFGTLSGIDRQHDSMQASGQLW